MACQHIFVPHIYGKQCIRDCKAVFYGPQTEIDREKYRRAMLTPEGKDGKQLLLKLEVI